MNNRRRQKIRALNMMIRSKSNGKFSYSSILNIAKELMDAIAVVLFGVGHMQDARGYAL